MNKIYSPLENHQFNEALIKLDNHLNLSDKSLTTRRAYLNKVRFFMQYTQSLPENLTKHEIIHYLLDIKAKRDIGSASLKMYTYAIRYYLLYISDRPDLYEKIPLPKRRHFNISILNSQEISSLISVCKNSRELLLLQLLFETGIRVGEITRLKIEDFDLEKQTISILDSKNNTSRIVYFGQRLLKTFIQYNQDYKSLFSDTLFNRQFHPFIPMTSRGVSWVLNALAKRVGLKKRLTPHTLRHTFAVHYLNAGGTIYQLRKLLGHKYIQTTLYYLEYAQLPESFNISLLDKARIHPHGFSPLQLRA
jgi:integrase/recombinase XerD